jgi:hypothetical protein
MVTAFTRIAEGLRKGAGRRAWRVTGDYGSGKSSFALVLAHLLRDPSMPSLSRLRREIAFEAAGVDAPRLIPILVTGSREPIVPAIAGAVERAITERRFTGARQTRALTSLAMRANRLRRAGQDVGSLIELLTDLAAYSAGTGNSGVLLVLDELGKFLEFAALHPEREDVYVLQRLAEAAARSSNQPLVVLGILHQGFHAYADRLPIAARQEWEKVGGRFDEIVFDQPLVHTAALVSGALNVRMDRLPPDLVRASRRVELALAATGWYGSLTPSELPQPLALYPLHPTVLPVLVRFFARFGQHERSLFSFLLSSEPFGLLSFADRPPNADTWYRLSDFYDYARAVFGHRLAGASYRSQWLRIAGIVDGLSGLDLPQLNVVKAVAILNLLDAEQLLATGTVLDAAVGGQGGAVEKAAIAFGLTRASTLRPRSPMPVALSVRRGASQRIWDRTSMLRPCLRGVTTSNEVL